jgi:hypothetical protein
MNPPVSSVIAPLTNELSADLEQAGYWHTRAGLLL